MNFTRAAENQFVSQPTFSYQIKLLEEEIGFAVFERSGKGAALTPAGEQFVLTITSLRDQLKRAIEQGQNFSAKYKDSISINMMTRSSLYFLPEAIRLMADTHPEIQIEPQFLYNGGLEAFLKNESDIHFTLEELTRQIPSIKVHRLFTSRIYLIARRDDPLADKDLITEEDLYGRTLMVGGGSPAALRAVQQRFSRGTQGCPATSHFFRTYRLFQQSRSRYNSYKRRGRQRSMSCPGFSQRSQRAVCLDPF